MMSEQNITKMSLVFKKIIYSATAETSIYYTGNRSQEYLLIRLKTVIKFSCNKYAKKMQHFD